jgi:hypothetical protein
VHIQRDVDKVWCHILHDFHALLIATMLKKFLT